jgi:lysophospholipase L1-like esterase
MVQNAGLDGHSTRGHLLMMETVVPRISPDMVVLLVGVNDLSYSINERHYLFGNPNERTGLGYYLYAKSRLAQLLYTWYQVYVHKAPVVRPERVGSPEGYYPKPLLDPTPLPESLESILPSLGEFRSNVRLIIKRAREINVTPVFLTQPLLFDDTPYWEGIAWTAYWLGRQKYSISAATFYKMQTIFNKALLEICEAEEVPCFDLNSALPHDQKYFYDSAHFNEAGAARVAEEVSDFLEREGLILPGGDGEAG